MKLKTKDTHRSAERESLNKRIAEMKDFLNGQTVEIPEYDEQLVRRLIEKITVYKKFEVEFEARMTVDVNR